MVFCFFNFFNFFWTQKHVIHQVFWKSRANVIFSYKLVAIFTSVCCQVLSNTYHHKKFIFKILLCFSHMPCLLLLLNCGKSSPFPCRVKKSTLLRFVLLFISVIFFLDCFQISWVLSTGLSLIHISEPTRPY